MSAEEARSGGYSSGGGNRGGGNAKRKPRRRVGFRKKRPPADLRFDYKDLNTLLNFLTEEGKIVAGRVSGLSAKQQRELTTAVKRARQLAFVGTVQRTYIQ